MNNIVDKDGNPRFFGLEGSHGEIAATYSYCRMEVSGGHLMLVAAFNVEAGNTLATYSRLGVFRIPDWIVDKVYAVNGTHVGNIEFKEVSGMNSNAVPLSTAISTYLQITSEKTLVISIDSSYTNNTGETAYFRVQYDLIIDSD